MNLKMKDYLIITTPTLSTSPTNRLRLKVTEYKYFLAVLKWILQVSVLNMRIFFRTTFYVDSLHLYTKICTSYFLRWIKQASYFCVSMCLKDMSFVQSHFFVKAVVLIFTFS